MRALLTRADFEQIGNFPASFEVIETLDVFIIRAEETLSGWLTSYWDSLKTSLESETPLTPEQEKAYGYIRRYLANLSMALYMGESNVIFTESGPVEKQTDHSSPITEGQRAALARKYTAEADRYAVLLRPYVPRETCSDASALTQTQVTVVRGRKRSRFESGGGRCCIQERCTDC